MWSSLSRIKVQAHHKSSGFFTTKSAAWLAQGYSLSNRPPWQCKWIWNIDTMPKIKVFLWQLCHNALLVRGILFWWGWNIEPHCPLCATDVESIDHLFWGCRGTNRVWELVVQHQWIPYQLLHNFTQDWTRSFEKINKFYRLKELQKLSFFCGRFGKRGMLRLQKWDIRSPSLHH